MGIAKSALKAGMACFGVTVTKLEYLTQLRQQRAAHADTSGRREAYLAFISAAPADQARLIAAAAIKAQSQLGQDLFVLSELGLKREGFFVEFGATNGVNLSNSCLLEQSFGWSGILAEPARCWHSELRKNRSCVIDDRCVWSRSGESLQFSEASDAEYSTVGEFRDSDGHLGKRSASKTYDIETVSLNDLLERHKAPKEMDYLSIDTEGSEFDILQALDFGKHSFRVITCEHNFTPARETIFALLSSKGYVRKYPELSKWDDWYVRA